MDNAALRQMINAGIGRLRAPPPVPLPPPLAHQVVAGEPDGLADWECDRLRDILTDHHAHVAEQERLQAIVERAREGAT